MKLHPLFGHRAIAVVLTAIAGKAGAVVPANDAEALSVKDRVATLRAKVAQLSTAQLHDGVTPAIGQPAQVTWNDWKNE